MTVLEQLKNNMQHSIILSIITCFVSGYIMVKNQMSGWLMSSVMIGASSFFAWISLLAIVELVISLILMTVSAVQENK